ncbi:MAG: CinA family nicotinamide mononucleotide deamidase-related protein [Alphaproteobacteria bacterium]|nr:CinA family nicotinamide mononucleotide deamidase-related protein [Alphaproteobacteria bacterium]MCB9690897.1 CinA family nicotinamide mononucleotide deamidase-related protein [Alphaproteobacteria bacterium]
MSTPTVPLAEILSQGDEVVTGQVVDSNAAWLAEKLTHMGFLVVRHTSVGDRLADLVQAFTEASGRADVVVCSGGLGPTEDDLTAEAIAQAFGRPLALDEVALADLIAKYERFRRVMPEVNRKQAWLPEGSQRLDNDWGTAPGFAVEAGRAWMAFMPGVPREMKRMFEHRVVPLIAERFHLLPAHLVTFRTTGCGESNLQEMLTGLALPEGVVLAFRTKLPENHVKLRFPASMPASGMAAVVDEVGGRLGRHLFTIEGAESLELSGAFDTAGGDLAARVARQLLAREATLATAESCTGGRVAVSCTLHSGSSAWFLEGAVTYSNAAKVRQLGVPEALLEAHGAVSEPVARAMAEGIRERAGATYGLSTTGIAGPTGATPDKPVGTVHIALATPSGTEHRELHLSGERDRIQILAASAALDLLRRHLA